MIVFEKAKRLLLSVLEFCERMNIVLSQDEGEIVNYALETPKFAIKECELILNLISQEETSNKNRTFKFWIDKTYGKKYYVAAALAENAIGIKEKDADCWEIEFDGTQIREIELMEYMFSESGSKYPYAWEYVRDYLIKASILSRLQFRGKKFLEDELEENGYDSHITHCLFYDMSKAIRRIKKDIVDELYSQMAKEGRLTPRWKNEYHLYSLINSMCGGATYQYHVEWLGQQSFDIYLEKLSVAIEYQGEQHYEKREFFGGKEGLEKNIERDKRKKELASENGVRLLEWHYSVPVNEENVAVFLEANGIPYKMPERTVAPSAIDNVSIMAPVRSITKEKKSTRPKAKCESKYVIRKYDLEGNYLQEYETAGKAAIDVNLSETSIGKCLRGERKSSGGFLWRKELRVNLPRKISIDDNKVESKVKKEALPIPIIQLTKEGEIVATFVSIRQAVMTTGIESKGIRDVLNGKRKTAGGYVWKKQT